jgi:hypothetical protein
VQYNLLRLPFPNEILTMQQPAVHPHPPAKRPAILLVLAIGLLMLGVLLTPALLIKLGPMRGSLTHSNEMVRRSTLLEVNALRAMCFAGFAVLLAVTVKWEAFRSSRFVGGILAHQENPREAALQRRVVNTSLWVSLAALAVWLAYVAFGHRLFSKEAVTLINSENGPIELGTALLFLIASISSAVLAWKSRYRPRKVFLVILALGFFVCTGEELSWGQHLFGWEAPESMAKVNVQAETNLHNLSGYFADHVFIAGVFFCGGIVPFVAAFSPVWRRVFDRFGIVVPSLGLAVGFLLFSLNQPYFVDPLVGRNEASRRRQQDRGSQELRVNPVRIQEGRELLSALGFCLLLGEAFRARRMALGDDTIVAADSATRRESAGAFAAARGEVP